MATLYSKAAGPANWSTLGTFNTLANGTGTDTTPTAADAVIVQNGHTVTLDTTGLVALSVVVNNGGVLTCATGASSALTIQNGLTQATGSNVTLDVSSDVTKTCTITLNNVRAAAASNYRWYATGTATVILKGFPKTRWTTLTAGVSAAGTTASVAAATGWQTGDKLCFGTTHAYNATPRVDMSTGTNTVSGTSLSNLTAFAYDHASGGLVGNFSSNLVIKGNTAGDATCLLLEHASRSGYTRTITDVEFNGLSATAAFPAYGLTFRTTFTGADGTGLTTPYTRVGNNAFYDLRSNGMFFSGLNTPIPRDNNVFYMPSCTTSASCILGVANTYTGDDTNTVIFRSAGGGIAGNMAPGSVFTGAQVTSVMGTFSAASFVSGIAVGSECSFVNTDVYGCRDAVGVLAGGSSFATSRIGTQFGGAATNSTVFTFSGIGKITLTDSYVQSSGTLNTALATATPGASNNLVNRSTDVTTQERYLRDGNIIRSNSEINRSASSIGIRPLALASNITKTQSIPCPNGASVLVVGYCKADTAFYNGGGAGWNAPTAVISGLGITPVAFTASSAANNAFEKFDLTATNSSGTDGNLTLTFTANAKSVTTGTVYFDGVPDSPFVTKVRHYGFRFDEANPVRFVNPTTSADEATAAGYTGVTVTWATSAVTLGANKTFQVLYDQTQYMACLPAGLPFAAPIVGVGLAGAASLFAQGNVTTTGYTLNGNGSLSMDVYTLTASLPWVYTYTGGTFSQSSTVPSFGGGQLNIGAAGTFTLGMSASTIISMTPTASGTYAMGASTFTGTVDLRNTSAHAITVQLPTGTIYTTASNVGGTITVSVPTVTQGLNFTGLSAGSQVKVFTTATTTELFTTGSSGTSETWSQAGGSDTTVDYTVMKAGFLPIRVVGLTVNSAVVAVPVSQVVDRSYTASSGLTYGSTATVNTGTSRFTVTVATTIQNWYSFMIESWIAEAGLKNRAFPISSNGPNSFTLEGWEFSAGISFLYRDGLRYTSTGVATAIYSAIYSVDTEAGMQVRYQQADGTGTTDAATTGKIDQLIQVYGDASHGSFDKRGFLTLKVQRDGYDQAETDVVSLYGSMEDQLYVVGLNPISNGLATGSPFVAGSPTITDHGASPVTWNSKQFSITITDSATGNTAENLMRWIRYNLSLGGTFQGKDAFNWHDLVQLNGSAYKTVRGVIHGDTGATLKGVRVLTDAGDPHPDFNLFTSDDGTTYAPPPQISISIFGLIPGSRVQLYDTTNSVELLNEVAGIASVFTETYSVDRAIRLRVAYVDGTDARKFVEANIGSVSEGEPILTYQLAQVNDEVYIANGIDGSTVTECEIVGTNLFIGINTGSISIARIYAFMVYWLSTVGGIEDQTTEMIAKDTANYIVNTGFQIRNATTGPTIPLLITGGNIDPATGIATDILDTSGGSIFVNSAIVVPFSSGAEATVAIVQAGLSAQGLTVPVVARLDAPVTTRATAGDIFAAT